MQDKDWQDLCLLMKYVTIGIFILILFLILFFYALYKIDKQVTKKYNALKPTKLQKHSEIIYVRKQRKKDYLDLLDLNQSFIEIIEHSNAFFSTCKVNKLFLKENRIFIFNFLKQCLVDDVNKYLSDTAKQNEISPAFDILIEAMYLYAYCDEIDWKALETIIENIYIIFNIVFLITTEIEKTNNNIGKEIFVALNMSKNKLIGWNRVIYYLKYEGYEIKKTMHMYEFYVDFFIVFLKYLDGIERLEN